MNCRIPRINRFLNAFCTFGVYPEVRLVQCFLFFVPAALRGQLALLCANGSRPRWRMNGIRARSRSVRMGPEAVLSPGRLWFFLHTGQTGGDGVCGRVRRVGLILLLPASCMQ